MRVIEWQQKEHRKAMNGQHTQVRKYTIENEVDATKCTIEHLRIWIYVLRKIKKKSGETQRKRHSKLFRISEVKRRYIIYFRVYPMRHTRKLN